MSEVQKDQPNNPSQAKFGADWAKTKAAYPAVGKYASKVKAGLANDGYKVTSKWSPSHPFIRVCVPVRPANARRQSARRRAARARRRWPRPACPSPPYTLYSVSSTPHLRALITTCPRTWLPRRAPRACPPAA